MGGCLFPAIFLARLAVAKKIIAPSIVSKADMVPWFHLFFALMGGARGVSDVQRIKL